eukprot:gene18391-20243_t
MGIEPFSVAAVTRLGRRVTKEQDKGDVHNQERPRPVKVIFEHEKAKGYFMKSLKNLASAEQPYKKVSIVHDMTEKERKINKEKIEEAKRRNTESSGEFKYIVTGPPWERKVVKTKPK